MTQDINTALGITTSSDTPAKPAIYEARAAKSMTRYKDGYLHARTIDAFGTTIKVISVIIGALLAIAGFNLSSSAGFGGIGVVLVIAMIAGGLLIGGLGYILGVLVKSAGQSMMAHYDCAVNGSHFLNDDQRAEVMSLE